MITIDDAIKKVLEKVILPDPIKLPLEYVSGMVLAEDISADIDIPPFDKATMDGFAIVASDSGDGSELVVDYTLPAGDFPKTAIKRGHAARIMTGAPVPDGANAVIKVELTDETAPERIKLKSKIEKGMNIAKRATEVKKGDKVLSKGSEITPLVSAVLAQTGCAKVSVYPRPSALILSTGSELVEIDQIPEGGEIRESNSYCLLAKCHVWGAAGSRRPLVADRRESLTGAFEDALEMNPEIIIISGGVSVGDFDLVPDILKKLGAEIIFHSVAQKPGKPMLFASKDETLVFGLPGNPVAVFLTFELYVGPVIRRMLGESSFQTTFYTAKASGEFIVKTDRTYLPASQVINENGQWVITPVKSKGSADMVGIINTNAFAMFDEGSYTVNPGDEVKFFFQRGKSVGT
jgi:molybdopterin molybdotransferase